MNRLYHGQTASGALVGGSGSGNDQDVADRLASVSLARKRQRGTLFDVAYGGPDVVVSSAGNRFFFEYKATDRYLEWVGGHIFVETATGSTGAVTLTAAVYDDSTNAFVRTLYQQSIPVDTPVGVGTDWSWYLTEEGHVIRAGERLLCRLTHSSGDVTLTGVFCRVTFRRIHRS